MEKQKNRVWFWILNGIIAVVILIFIIQNWQQVTFNLLGLKLEGLGFLVFLVIFAMGFAGGWLWENLRWRKKQKQDSKKHNEQSSND